jgi:hypothetical protein
VFVHISAEGGENMDTVTLIRAVAGILFVVILGVLIMRRKKTA